METKTQTSTGMDVRMIPLAYVFRNPNNPRKVKQTDPSIKELAESIKGTNGLIQAIVVREDAVAQRFELLAGERRTIACRLAGFMEIKAEVIDVDDATAIRIMVVENLQRKDLTPLEEAANLKLMLDQGEDKKEIAARLGRTLPWVARRAKLLDLSPKWWKAMTESNGDNFHFWGVGHLELIARYNKPVQEELLEALLQTWFRSGIADLERFLEGRMHTVKSTPWKADDDTLLPKAGACTDCQKRSCRQPELFHDEQDQIKIDSQSRCLDFICWDKKMQQYLEGRRALLREKHPKLVEIATENMPQELIDAGVLQDRNYDNVKKSTKGALPGLVVHGPGIGKFCWIKKRNLGQGGSSPRKLEKGAKLSDKERKARLERRRAAFAVSKVRDMVDKKGSAILEYQQEQTNGQVEFLLLAAVAAFGTGSLPYGRSGSDWFHFQKLTRENSKSTSDPFGMLNQVWLRLRPVFLDMLIFHDQTQAQAKLKNARLLCELIGFDFKAITKEAEKEIPVPKAWSKQTAKAKTSKGKGSSTKRQGRRKTK